MQCANVDTKILKNYFFLYIILRKFNILLAKLKCLISWGNLLLLIFMTKINTCMLSQYGLIAVVRFGVFWVGAVTKRCQIIVVFKFNNFVFRVYGLWFYHIIYNLITIILINEHFYDKYKYYFYSFFYDGTQWTSCLHSTNSIDWLDYKWWLWREKFRQQIKN